MAFAEVPFWRDNGEAARTTSSMLQGIVDYLERYERLSTQEKIWAMKVYYEKALAEFLFQVNKIEGEGFDTLEQTKEAISNGALRTEAGWKEDDDRIEHVGCLHRALTQWFSIDKLIKPDITTNKLLKTHQLLLESTHPDIAGRLREKGEEVFVRTTRGKQHFFKAPETINTELKCLFSKAGRQLQQMSLESKAECIQRLVEFGVDFFFNYEAIHPFCDGNGRTGRIMLARILQPITVFPNVLYVDRSSQLFHRYLYSEEEQERVQREPPFVDRDVYKECFENAQESDGVPRDLTALVIEGVYVGWKRFFDELHSVFIK